MGGAATTYARLLVVEEVLEGRRDEVLVAPDVRQDPDVLEVRAAVRARRRAVVAARVAGPGDEAGPAGRVRAAAQEERVALGSQAIRKALTTDFYNGRTVVLPLFNL